MIMISSAFEIVRVSLQNVANCRVGILKVEYRLNSLFSHLSLFSDQC